MRLGETTIISLLFFKSYKVAARRLLALEKANIINPNPLKCVNGFKSFHLTKFGYEVLRSRSTNPLLPKLCQRETKITFEHDRIIGVIRAVMGCENKYSTWFSERELLHKFSEKTIDGNRILTPDALYYDLNEIKYSLEVEYSRKPSKRLKIKYENQELLIKEGLVNRSLFVCHNAFSFNYLNNLSNNNDLIKVVKSTDYLNKFNVYFNEIKSKKKFAVIGG
jgi:hypothetical protein